MVNYYVQKFCAGMEKGMSNYKHIRKTYKKAIIHTLAAVIFCVVLGIGTVSMAYPETPATVTVESAKIRSSADTSSAALASVKKNETVSICDEVTGTDGKVWYQVFVDANTKGYIRSDLVQKSGSSTSAATGSTENNTTASTNLPETNVTAVEKKTGTVVTNNVRIRKGASTEYGVVATANKGMVLTVTGEATGGDGKTWYQVSFTYNSKEIVGFIRSDLVTFETVTPDSAVSQITGTETNGEDSENEPTTEAMTEAEPTQEEQTQEEQQASSDDSQNIILMNVDEEIYVMPGFEKIILNWQDQQIDAYKNGDFYIFYAQKQNGEQGWYVFDSTNGTYQRYAYASVGVTVPETSSFEGGMLIVFILGIIIVVLLVAVCILFLKLREYTSEVYEDEYFEDDEEAEPEVEQQEFYEEEIPQEPRYRERPRQQRQPRRQQEDISTEMPREDVREVQRSQRQNPNTASAIRQNPNYRQNANNGRYQENGKQQMRTDDEVKQQRQSQNRVPVQRMEEQSARQQQRPNQNRAPQQANRRPQQQNNKTSQNMQPQKGYKAKNFLEAEDDDMNFIDI